MRREWSGWIKNRQWSEFERLAKTEPNQVLADTVAELERGFPDKADRRALRKVLFLLSRAGIKPQPIELDTEEKVEEKPFEFGYLVSADGRGDAVVSYGVQEGKRVRWLVAHLNGKKGVTDASEEDFSVEDSRTRVKNLMESAPRPFMSAPIAPELAIGMLADAVSNTKGTMPPVVAYWRSRLRNVTMPEHPAEALPRADDTDERTRRRVPMMMDATLLWRLELGTAAPLLRDLYEAQMNEALSEDEKNERTDAALAAARETAFDAGTIRDHAHRLRDLAYILHLKGEEGSGLLLNTLDDLRTRGAQSDYAIGMMDKTVVLLAETLRAQGVSDPRRIDD